MISTGLLDRAGRHVALCEVDDDNWRAVADVAPLDGQRAFAPALAARYLLLSSREDVWHSLAVTADDRVVGHVMWARDEDDGSHWIGGVLVDGPEQGTGVGRAAVRTLMAWLAGREDCHVLRLSYEPANTAAAHLWTSLGFRPTAASEGDEVVVELPAGAVTGSPTG